jgi:hypothetical protein
MGVLVPHAQLEFSGSAERRWQLGLSRGGVWTYVSPLAPPLVLHTNRLLIRRLIRTLIQLGSNIL